MKSGPAIVTLVRVLFFLRAINFDRVFENALRELLGRGHAVHVVVEREKRGLPGGAGSVLAELAETFPDFGYEHLARLEPAPQTSLTRDLRLSLDYLRYLAPEYAHAEALRDRAERNAPKAFARRLRRRPWLRRPAAVLLRALEARLPVPGSLVELVRAQHPDVVLVAPVIELGSPQVDALRAAGQLGIPTVLPVASWDNLSNKGLVKEIPNLTVVWNEAQVDEAVHLHGIPRARTVAVGAHAFDHWFAWEPSTTREEFAAAAGFEPSRALLLYTCSSAFVAREEAAFVRDWLSRLRAHPDERLREAAVMIRPHPQGVTSWDEFPGREPGKTVVWPRAGESPADDRRKRDYFDSISHAAAVVGVNTSAFIEAAILRTPVYTLVDERFRRTQEGTLHFAHLSDVLVVAQSWEEHLAQLADALARPGARAAELERFVGSFVRPAGLDRPAAPLLADAVERAAGERGRRAHRPGLVGRLWPFAPALLAKSGRASAFGRRVRRAVSARAPKRA